MTIALTLKKQNKKKRMWVKGWLARVDTEETHHTLLNRLQCEDITHLRMDGDTFQFTVLNVSNFVAKRSTHLRNVISVEDRLVVILRCLAIRESFGNWQFSTRIPQCTISNIFLKPPKIFTSQ